MVELRAASDEDYHDSRVVEIYPTAEITEQHDVTDDGNRPRYTTRFLLIRRLCQNLSAFIFGWSAVINEGPTVVETVAVEVTSLDSRLVLSCSYDSEDPIHSGAFIHPGIFRVLERNVFSPPSPKCSQMELQSFL